MLILFVDAIIFAKVQLLSQFWTRAEIREGLISRFFWCFH